MTMKPWNLMLLFLMFSILMSSCITRENSDWTFEQDNAISSELFQDVYKQVDATAQSDANLKSCANVTLSDTLGNFPNTVTIDFGTGCLGADGRTRTGVITATFNGPWRDSGSVVDISFDNYTVDGYGVEGTAAARNAGTSSRGYLSYEFTVNNGSLNYPDGDGSQWSGSTLYELAEGANTSFASNGLSGITDDLYHVGGTISGVNRNGTPYTAVITEYLVRDMSCRWIKQGRIELTPQNGETRTIDFGDGTCDAQANFSIGNLSFDFLLP